LLFLPYLVPGVPVNVKLKPHSPHQLQLTWNIPSEQNGKITGYHVTWRLVRNDTNHPIDGPLKTEEVPGEESKSYIIDNLGMRNIRRNGA
jgi:hypothetical protein